MRLGQVMDHAKCVPGPPRSSQFATIVLIQMTRPVSSSVSNGSPVAMELGFGRDPACVIQEDCPSVCPQFILNINRPRSSQQAPCHVAFRFDLSMRFSSARHQRFAQQQTTSATYCRVLSAPIQSMRPEREWAMKLLRPNCQRHRVVSSPEFSLGRCCRKTHASATAYNKPALMFREPWAQGWIPILIRAKRETLSSSSLPQRALEDLHTICIHESTSSTGVSEGTDHYSGLTPRPPQQRPDTKQPPLGPETDLPGFDELLQSGRGRRAQAAGFHPSRGLSRTIPRTAGNCRETTTNPPITSTDP
ncbi:hypothetical protein B0T11DRAFT_287650 [Plectosphaerella cucumerina]|uniref:Uncharacterized protein n=1 Tax=Plectosphaerella cucumerina TaxID=40658 RepID=A0A8K0X1T7_9PEZI|nr:hypothetical protein B0T11DRAFT_287650 [Plectosphaerella cucumerina]